MLDLLIRPTAKAASNYSQDPLSGFWYGAVSPPAYSGETVTTDSAIRVAAVYACVRVLAESVAALPVKLFERQADGSKKQLDNSESELLSDMPNGYQTVMEFYEFVMWNLQLRGNFLAFRSADELRPVDISRVRNYRLSDSGTMEYEIETDVSKDWFAASELLHVRGPSLDGMWGATPVSLMRQPIGLAIAGDRLAGSQIRNGVRPSGVYEHPASLGDEAYNRLKASIDSQTGAGNAGRTMILEEGMKWHQVAMSNEDAQFLESRKYQVEEIARIYRVPLHMLQMLDRSTFSNIEQQSLEFVVHSLRPWLVRIEKSLRRDVISRPDWFVEFNVDGLLRGDTASRYAAYASALQNEWMSVNEVRSHERMNPIEGGDRYQNPAINPQDRNANPAARVAAAFATDIAKRIATKLSKSTESRVKHATSDRERFNEWITQEAEKLSAFADSAVADFCGAFDMSDAGRVALVESIAIGPIRTMIAAESPEALHSSWNHTLVNSIKSSILESVA